MPNFSYRGTDIRTVKEGGRVWFIAQDICDALELVNPSMVVSTQVKESDTAMVRVDTLGGPQKLLGVNDIGLYEIILSARTPKARAFEEWVSGEMLPKLGIAAPSGAGAEKGAAKEAPVK